MSDTLSKKAEFKRARRDFFFRVLKIGEIQFTADKIENDDA
jgi:hypothetical protein